MSKDKSTIQTEFGEYVPLQQRLPDFHKRFPLDDGYAIEIKVGDLLSYKPGLLSLYAECARSGTDPESIGLPPLKVGPELVFTAQLVKDGQVLNSASNLRIIAYEKDFNRGETGARQRLVAACGFPGGVQDLEEDVSSSSDGLRLKQPEAASGTDVETDSDIDDDLDALSDDQSTDDEPPVAVKVPETPASDIPPHLQQQVNTLCASLDAKNQDYQKPTTREGALKFLREQRKGNGASP